MDNGKSYVDTTITWREDSSGRIIERLVQYDSLGAIVFETATVSIEETTLSQYLDDIDAQRDAETLIRRSHAQADPGKSNESVEVFTIQGAPAMSPEHTFVISSDMTNGRPILGSVVAMGRYHLWTPTASADTLALFLDVVRKGSYLCFRDEGLMRDAYVLEHRKEGYGKYANVGRMVIPSIKDTLPMWSFADITMPKPIVWDWEALFPMSIEQYRAIKAQLNSVHYVFDSNPMFDSIREASR